MLQERTKMETPLKSPVTLEEIEAIEDLDQARTLSKKFPQRVSLKKCGTVDKQKERLRLAVAKAEGKMKDIDELGNVMTQKRGEDEKNRIQLLQLFQDLKVILYKMDDKMRNHVNNEYATRHPEEQITKYSRQLAYPPTKIVVAGETSSGKSTLLNIFISEDKEDQMLPVKLLSCTATICELSYGKQKKARVIKKDSETEINFDERHQYIYKESERDGARRQFEHEAVHLQLPSPFLKSGITLVDTPGIGESKEMGNVLKNFVKNNEVFGFIFTIASNRAGGVLQKFQNILRDLCTEEYVDNDGQKKFNPGCCMFVANFWDAVPDHNKQETKQNIFEKLNDLPFMHSFNAEEQVFFMDAEFAYQTKHAGYITEDFNKFIDGLSEFVWKEQRRKLKIAYGWLENSLQRLLHPVRSYMRRLKQTGTVRKKNRDKTVKYLEEIARKFQDIMDENRSMFEDKIAHVSNKLLEYMKEPKAKEKIEDWKSAEIPKEEHGTDWVLTEIGLDEAIDDRVSVILQDWEKEKRAVSSVEQDLLSTFTLQFEAVGNELESVERDIRSTNQHIELAMEQSDADDLIHTFQFPEKTAPVESRQFEVRFGRTHGSDIMMSKPRMDLIMDNLVNGPALKIFRSNSKSHSVPVKPDVEKYIKDRVAYMRERAKYIFSSMCTIEFTTSVVREQLKPVSEYLDTTEKVTLDVIKSNRKLLNEIAEERRGKADVEKLYAPIEEDIVNLLDTVLLFGKSHVVNPDFVDGDFVMTNEKLEPKSLFCSLGYGKMTEKQVPKNKRISFKPEMYEVTFKKTRGLAAPSLKPSDRFFQEKNLRQFARRGDVVKLLGIYNIKTERVFVLEGTLLTARQHLLQDRLRSGAQHRKRTLLFNFTFLSQLGNALTFLHLKKLVHVELSLDSILVKKVGGVGASGVPLLCNLCEPTRVPLCPNPKVPVSQYIHLPPEVLKQKSLYTQEADIYGIGIIMLELWNQKDVFADIKKTVELGKWISKEDQGEALIQEAKSYQKKYQPGEKMTEAWKEVVSACLTKNPLKRLTAKLWQDELAKLMNTTLS